MSMCMLHTNPHERRQSGRGRQLPYAGALPPRTRELDRLGVRGGRAGRRGCPLASRLSPHRVSDRDLHVSQLCGERLPLLGQLRRR
eukprot:CAMPEP_0196701108 /NCGR_PEP_ID=MMETSP1090-20130531/50740_1 /TAXON_ID=37098 /ORGANISM="Isochrysis sp, Strain CCMP1244" /LENGTH=85 /DNA_ID=CAMNT_0042040875 /DNA_START=190 /DNA_END=444 /DNA_ORIENTATION=-